MDDRQYAQFKRLLETWEADPVFRREAEAGTPGLFPSGERNRMMEAIEAIHRGQTRGLPNNPYATSWLERVERVTRYVEESVSPSAFRSPEISGYLRRVRNRCGMEAAVIRSHPNIHYFPMAWELSHGCRVGCEFCGLMAERWTANAKWNPAQWHEMLQSAFELLGPILGESPCFFATEPMDHPDYEHYIAEVEAVTGRFPQTTTAVANRFPDRIRGLMRLLGEERLRDQCRLRISIRSLRQFRQIMQLFSPEELVHVELLANNTESILQISDSGRSRTQGAEQEPASRSKIRYSICCMAGVRANLADRTLTFLEPVLPDDTWPCGYRALETEHFENAGDFRPALEALFRRYALASLPRQEQVQLHPEVKIIRQDGFILLAGDGVAFRMQDNPWNALALERLRAGASFESLFEPGGLPAWTQTPLYALLDRMFQRGYIIYPIYPR